MRIRTRTIVLFVAEGLKHASTILLAVVLVRLIAQEAFGTYRQAILVFTMLFGLGSLNLASSLFYFIPRLGPERRLQITAQTIGLILATTTIVAFTMWLGADPIARFFKNPELSPLIKILAPYALSEGILTLVPTFMISLDRAVRSAVYGIVVSLTRVAAVLGLAYAGYDLDVIVGSMVVVSFAVAAVGLADMLRLCPKGESRLDVALLRQQLAYCLPLWMTALVGILNIQYDKVLISRFFDPSTYAVYAVGAMEVPLIALVTSSLASAIMPNLVASCSAGRKLEALSTWHEAGRKASFAIFPTFAVLLAASPDVIVFLYGEAYAEATWPFAIYLGLLPIRVFVYSAVLRAVADTGSIAQAALLGFVVNVVVSTSLVVLGEGSRTSFIGPSIGTVLAAFSMGAYQLIRIRSHMEVPASRLLRWGELGRILFPSLVVGAGVALLPLEDLPLIARLAVRGGVFFALLGSYFWVGGVVNDEEKAMVRQALSLSRFQSGRR